MKLNYLGLNREALLEESRKNREKLIQQELAAIKSEILNAVKSGLETTRYLLRTDYSHIAEELVIIIEESGLTANYTKMSKYTMDMPRHDEILISWKDESGIQLVY